MDKDNGIQESPSWDKTILLYQNQRWKKSQNPKGEDFGNDLIKRVSKTNGSKLIHTICSLLFGDQGNKSTIQFF